MVNTKRASLGSGKGQYISKRNMTPFGEKEARQFGKKVGKIVG